MDPGILIIQCFRNTLKKHQFEQCKTRVLEKAGKPNNEELTTMDQMKQMKRCMKTTVKGFQNSMQGAVLNRMFGGQCGSTALALMNMIPLPFDQFNSRNNVKPWKETRAFKLMMHLMEKPDPDDDEE